MKLCQRCNEEKPEEDFNWRYKNKRRQSYCKACQSLYTKEHYQKNKEPYIERAKTRNAKIAKEYYLYIEQYLSTHPCVDCGESDIVVLEFDHKSDKVSDVSKLKYHNIEVLKKEIEKCEVRCANCHRRKTSITFNWWRNNI